MANTNFNKFLEQLFAILQYNDNTGSVNLYMAHGGTNFGWTAGARASDFLLPTPFSTLTVICPPKSAAKDTVVWCLACLDGRGRSCRAVSPCIASNLPSERSSVDTTLTCIASGLVDCTATRAAELAALLRGKNMLLPFS